ncbi:helix-turn-helix domain-containing protein [Nonomuraea rosea]|uniref:Helix-turn-helix domain-containing protein n=1 Tax=Nonomuraea rosea TaxID=638574 RepID=A0ABP6ZV69_9ACTN
MDPVKQLLHPVRLRILHALSAASTLTIAQMCARMPEVPKITVYRQVAQLTEGGFLEVDGEQRVRGAVERRYRLCQDRPTIDADAAAAMSLDDHRRAFTASMAVLIAEFNAYLDRDGADPTADTVSYRQGTLWLSPDELTEMMADLLAVVRDRLANTPASGRTPYLLSAIFFPTSNRRAHGPGR